MTSMSPGAKAAMMAALIIVIVIAGLFTDYAVATWRADQAVGKSERELCTIVRLVTKTPVTKPPDPQANPSRESSYEFYEAFAQLGREYQC